MSRKITRYFQAKSKRKGFCWYEHDPNLAKIIAAEEADLKRCEDLVDENGQKKYHDLRNLYNYFQPTEEDMKRTYTEEELKELCLKTKCKVNMTLFNPVWDAKHKLLSQGRLQNRSYKYENKILTKAVMKHKTTAIYKQERIDCYRQTLWRERKKANNILLSLWSHERMQQTIEAEANSVNNSTESLTDSILSQFNESSLTRINSIIHFDSQTKNLDNILLDISNNNNFNNNLSEPGYHITADDDVNEIIIDDSVIKNEESLSYNTQNNMDIIAAGLRVNTESMSFEDYTNLKTSETPEINIESQTEDLPYEVFNTQIPSTSTQSQERVLS